MTDSLPPTPNAGRPRDEQIDVAVLSATLQVLHDAGYANLSIGQVAQRAGVYRPAIYRRWPSKRHLVISAIATTIGVTPTPDTGDLRRDLLAGITTVADAFRDPELGHVLLPLISDLAAHPDLQQQFFAQVFHARRATTQTTLRNAIQRGEVRPDIDMEFVLDALAAPVYFRALFHHAPIDHALVEHTVDLVLADITTRLRRGRQ